MKKKVLIVDDNSTNRYLLKSLLEGEDFDVVAAENGQVALDSAHADPPGLIVSDILMPVMDGYMLCRKCKADDQLRQIPFIFYTATYTEPKDEKFALSLGADRFVIKPQEPEILLNVLQEVWEKRSEAKPAVPKPLGKEMEFFRQYNEILFRKLEEKMSDLEGAHRKLKCLEEQYRLSFENVTDIVWTIDADFNVQKMSPSVERMLGYESQDFISRSVFDLVKMLTPESMERATAEIHSVLSGQTVPVSVYSLVARDGTVKHGEFSGAPILRDGEIVGMVSVIRDITERKRVEEELRKKEARFRDLFQEAPVGYFEYDTQGLITRVNRTELDMLGYSGEEMVGRPVWKFIAEEETARQQILAKLAGALTSFQGFERTYRRKDGTLFPVLIQDRLMKDEQGNVTGIRCAIQDITDRKRAEEKLAESEKKYRDLYDFLPIPVYEMDFEANITSANRAIYETFGGTEDDLKAGFNAWQMLSPECIDASSRNIQRLLQGEKIEGTEYTVTRLDGSVFPAMIVSSVIYDRGKPVGLRGAVIDITERKQAEEMLLKTAERLRRSLAGTVQAMSMAVEARDPYTAGHQRRSADLARTIAAEMGFDEDRTDFVRIATTIHDLGKISVPAEILSKPTRLRDLEYELIKSHSQAGYEILRDIDFPWPVADVILQHHERMDGSGYPQGLKGDAILLEARIMAVADVVEAIASHRPYRPALGIDAALEEISKNRGILYDPDVTDACLKLFHEKGYNLH
jgi:PAS domain S-box-containing protein